MFSSRRTTAKRTRSCMYVMSFRAFLPRDTVLVRYMLSSCVRPSVRLSQAGVVSRPLDKLSWYLAWRLPSTCPTQMCCKKICVSPKIRVLYSGTLPNPGLGKFRCCKSISLLAKLVVVSSTFDNTYTAVDESWLFTTSCYFVPSVL